MTCNIPRIAVAAIQGRSGKTTFTIGLLKALRDRGMTVQPFKKGPDFIDPSWATYASGQTCRNLDAFMMQPEQIIHTFCQGAKHADLAVIEGAMGIFDGLDVEGSNSTAELAHLLKTPVVLVVSGQRITRSVAALINGVTQFDPRIHICGVVLNQVARPRHLNIMTRSIETYCDVPILGALPKTKEVEIPDRHLGLIPAGEQAHLRERLDRLGKLVSDHVDLDRLLAISKDTEPLHDPIAEKPIAVQASKPKIGVFRDEAFSFYYPENLEALEHAGAELVFLNSMQDSGLGDIQGLYIGGGFPEVLAETISANTAMLADVRRFSEAGHPIYAECGGLMYLSKGIETPEGFFNMAGVYPGHVRMEKRPQGHGYAIQETTAENPFFPAGMVVRGHEFHNSKMLIDDDAAALSFGYRTTRGNGLRHMQAEKFDGLVQKNTLGAYHHLHATSSPEWAVRFVSLAKKHCDKDN